MKVLSTCKHNIFTVAAIFLSPAILRTWQKIRWSRCTTYIVHPNWDFRIQPPISRSPIPRCRSINATSKSKSITSWFCIGQTETIVTNLIRDVSLIRIFIRIWMSRLRIDYFLCDTPNWTPFIIISNHQYAILKFQIS